MIHFLYNVILTCFLILHIPYLLLQSLLRKRPQKLMKERLGSFPDLSSKKPIWIHAASVGEVLCSIPLLKRIKKEVPDCEIVLTTMTSTGNETAKKLIPEADRILFFPIDHPFTIRRAIRKISPRLLLIAETELWPNLLRSCGRKQIPVVLFNGRISGKSFRGYLFLKSFFKRCLKDISFFLMQTEEDRSRIIEIGAPPDRTRVAGNIKFDQVFPSINLEAIVEMSGFLGLQGNETILLAGSTHQGEEEIFIQLFKDLRKADPHLILILAPRHLDRLEEVEKVLRNEDLSWKRRSSLSGQDRKEISGVILLDTMGELMRLYSLGTIVFIGGSLVPVGGHNPLEPLFFKKCVLFGPHMFNFLEISRRLIAEGGAILVNDREELSFQLKRLLSDERARNEVGQNGYRFLMKHRGATERIFEKIKPFLVC
ncbi:MAG: 3-deoxy-D-manno-octulosonic acid transferase [Thermodesulfobacteriota bacterium]|nr:3-deoxy-D-manno-octulosonic acid transferase [Thermodesulfobacteriota bacterium]